MYMIQLYHVNKPYLIFAFIKKRNISLPKLVLRANILCYIAINYFDIIEMMINIS